MPLHNPPPTVQEADGSPSVIAPTTIQTDQSVGLIVTNPSANIAQIGIEPTSATAALNVMVGDGGSGGTKGLVPAPAAGDAAADKFLKADATWTTPAGGGGLPIRAGRRDLSGTYPDPVVAQASGSWSRTGRLDLPWHSGDDGTDITADISAISVINLQPNDDGFSITGMAGGVEGKIVSLINDTDGNWLYLKNLLSGTPANQFNFPDLNDVIMPNFSQITLIYRNSLWELMGFAGIFIRDASGDITGQYPGNLITKGGQAGWYWGASTNISLGSDQNDYNIGAAIASKTHWPLDPTGADRTITGFDHATAGDDTANRPRYIRIENISTTYAIILANDNGASIATNQIHTPTGADIAIPPGQTASLMWSPDNSKWVFTDTTFDTRGGGPPSGPASGDLTGTYPAPTIAAGAVSNSKLADIATATLKGRTTAGTGSPEDLTATQATAILNAMVGDSGSGGTKGLVPAPASGDAAAAKFLKADATWAAPAAAGAASGDLTGTYPAPTIAAGAVSNSKLANVATATLKGRTTAGTGSPEDLTATQATAILNAMVGDSGSGGTKGLVPAPASGDAAAAKFLKADATWAAPTGSGAPSTSQYVTLANDAGLSAERVLTAGAGITLTDAGANSTITVSTQMVPTGAISPYAGRTAPTNWLMCDGTAVSRTTYAALMAVIAPTVGTFTVTIASPGVFTLNGHGLNVGDSVYLTTTGALPTGLSANTIYYVSVVTDANTFDLALTRGGANINTSGSQSGTHTLVFCPFGLGNGSTTFNVPDLRGRIPVGMDVMAGSADGGRLSLSNAMGLGGGEENHTLTTPEIAAHTHDLQFASGITASGGSGATPRLAGSGALLTSSTGGGGSHNNMQPYILVAYIVRT